MVYRLPYPYHIWDHKTTEESHMTHLGTVKNLKGLLFSLFAGTFGLFSCQETYQPKERGYPRFDLPKPHYVAYDQNHPYSFEVSDQAVVYKDSNRLAEEHWVNIKYPALAAEVQLTYKDIGGDMKMLNEYIEDSRTLINKHNIKAYGIEESRMRTAAGQTAYVFALTGQVPTQFQFYTTDSSRNFLRGALYFRTATANDSLAPAIRYISNDMVHLLNTLKWKNDR